MLACDWSAIDRAVLQAPAWTNEEVAQFTVVVIVQQECLR